MPDQADRVPLDGAFVLQFIMFASDGSLWMRTYTLPGPTDRRTVTNPALISFIH